MDFEHVEEYHKYGTRWCIYTGKLKWVIQKSKFIKWVNLYNSWNKIWMSIFLELNYRYCCTAFQINYYFLDFMSQTKDSITFLNKRITTQINIPMPQLKCRIELYLKRILLSLLENITAVQSLSCDWLYATPWIAALFLECAQIHVHWVSDTI